MRLVKAGQISALLDGAFLRRICVGEVEVLRGVYAAVRDADWATVEPTYAHLEVDQRADSFRVRFTAEHKRADIDFVWDGEYAGDPDGLVFRFDGECRSSFRKNRIGFCVLHPPELAGLPYVRETPAGLIHERFSELISPSRDVTDMRALRYAVGGIEVELAFEGDLFDMEDQRNWTDASYKTFCTPLARPYPVQVKAGDRIQQTVTIRLAQSLGRSVASASRAPAGGEADVVVSDRVVGRLPPIGLGASREPLTDAAVDRLRRLQLAHLWVELDLRNDGWRELLDAAVKEAAALETPLDVALVTDGGRLEEVADALRGLPVVRIAPFADGLWVTTAEVLERLKEAGVSAPVGGGSRTDFAQLNMRQALIPFGALEFVSYAVNPQVHTFDDLSIMETIGVQPATVASARALSGVQPIVVGPITLRPRFNPNATGHDARAPEADPRQRTSFTAAWMLGSLHRLAAADVDALSYFETCGPNGVMDVSGEPYPVYEVLASLAPQAGAEVLEVRLKNPLEVEALALRTGSGVQVHVANLTPASSTLSIALPEAPTRALDLGPYAVIRI